MNQTLLPPALFFFRHVCCLSGATNWPSTLATDGRRRTSEQKFWCLPVPPNDCETAPDSEEETEPRLVFALTGSDLHAWFLFFPSILECIANCGLDSFN